MSSLSLTMYETKTYSPENPVSKLCLAKLLTTLTGKGRVDFVLKVLNSVLKSGSVLHHFVVDFLNFELINVPGLKY